MASDTGEEIQHVADAAVNEVKQATQDKKQATKPSQVKEPSLFEELGKIAAAISSNPLHSEGSYILHWRDPVRTGLLFGILNFFYFLITYGDYSVLTLISYCALAILVAAFAYANGTILYGKYIQGLVVENPLSARWSDAEPVPRYVAEKHLDSLLNFVNAVREVARDVFYCNFPILSLKFAGLFFLLSLFGKWFSGFTLAYIAVLISFVWPRLYEEKRKEIDHFAKIANDQIETYTQLALSKIPKMDKRKTH